MVHFTQRWQALARTTPWTRIGLGAMCSLLSLSASAQAEWPKAKPVTLLVGRKRRRHGVQIVGGHQRIQLGQHRVRGFAA